MKWNMRTHHSWLFGSMNLMMGLYSNLMISNPPPPNPCPWDFLLSGSAFHLEVSTNHPTKPRQFSRSSYFYLIHQESSGVVPSDLATFLALGNNKW